MEKNDDLVGEWALILGASSGFGAACAVELASQGMNIFGVHLDRKATLPQAEELVQKLHGMEREAVFVNANAADAEKRSQIIDSITQKLASGGQSCRIRVLLHSLAFGTLRRFIAEEKVGAMTKA